MYSDWASLLPEIQSERGDQSVLSRYSYNTSREVVTGIVRNLSNNITRCMDGLEDNLLVTDSDVAWTMEIMCFGLSLPTSDKEVTSECVNIYCEWMTSLLEPRKSVPLPMVDDPNKYFSLMLTHLTHLFRPRNDGGQEYTSRHMGMCTKVLKATQNISSKSKLLNSESWNNLLIFLLTVSDNLLGPPSVKDDLGSQMCERLLCVLFETWLISCSSGHFPSPSLWKTLHEMCLGWRHHESLVTQWHRINFFLTSLLLEMFHGALGRPAVGYDDENSALSGFKTSSDVVIQCWFRFLHLIGNPIDFSRPRIISSTQKFLHAALASQEVVEPYQHECLKALPQIFFKAMKCISLIAASFLGSNQKSYVEMDSLTSISNHGQVIEPPSVTPPPARKQQRVTSFFPQLIKSKDASSRMSLGETWPPVTSISSPPTAPPLLLPPTYQSSTSVAPPQPVDGVFSFFRPRVNSLLHLLGALLFDTSLVGADVIGPQKDEDWGSDDLHQYEAGRAKSCGTLCQIFCSVKTDEEILHVYIARFYAVIYYGLKVDLETSPHPVLINIILNSSNIFKVNLIGSQVLIPHYLRAIDFLHTTFRYRHDNIDDDVDQRSSSIMLLLSMECLPLHFRHLEIKNILDDQKHMISTVTFYDQLPMIYKLLLNILSKEVDPVNTQMLLASIALLVADMAVFEEKSKLSKGLEELYHKSSLLIRERLVKSWTSELSSALCSLEVLQLFSTFKILKSRFRRKDGEEDEEEDISQLTDSVLESYSRNIVITICDFVIIQCSKPAIYHSKDLHSSIVSAYQCLTTWLVEHDYLLQDGAVLHTVLQVTELGISGSRSQPRPSDPPIYKGKKELKPISLRVKDAAEALLATIVDHVGSFPSPSGPESLCTLLDEDSFLTKFGRPKFQYFVMDGSVIMGLHEPPANDETEGSPSLVVITRSLFGRHAWFLKLCHRSKNYQTQSSNNQTPPITTDIIPASIRPQSSATPNIQSEVPRHFPDFVGQVPKVLADHSIPPIERTMPNYEEQLENLRKIIDRQKVLEEECYSHNLKNYKPAPPYEPPSSSKISNAARLFLSHFGFLTLDNLGGGSISGGMFPTLIKLDDSKANLFNDLKILDGISIRTFETVHVYYVKQGQNKIEEMLRNVTSESEVSPDFPEFLLSLGWPVEVESHPGWTGNPSTSWKVKDCHDNITLEDDTTGGSCYDGRKKLLYWSDVATEICFIVPSVHSVVRKDSPSTIDSDKPPKLSSMEAEGNTITVSSDGEKTLKLRRSGKVMGHGIISDTQVVVVWLEHYEDHATFPIDDLSKMSNHQQASEFKTNQKQLTLNSTNFCIIFVHPLNSGLFRIHLHVSYSKVGDGGPLVDGAVVSRRILGHMVRQTAYNVYRRKTLESDIHQPPHVKRRIFIKEMVQRYKCPMTESDFCTSLFQ